MNDSVLAQSYVYCFDISYPEALRRIERDVCDFKLTLEKEREHLICGIGRILVLDDGNYDFIPEETGITSPQVYGFAPYELALLKKEECVEKTSSDKLLQDYTIPTIDATKENKEEIFKQTSAIAQQAKVSNKNDDGCENKKEIAFHIPIHVLQKIAVACVILTIFFLFPSTLGDSSMGNLKNSSIDSRFIYEIMPKDITTGKPDNLRTIMHHTSHEGTSNEVKQVTRCDMTDSEGTVPQTNKPYYTIVLASRILASNANGYVEKLHKKGLVDARIYTSRNNTKIIYKSFGSKAEASKELSSLSKKAEFSGCWITEIK